MRPLLGLKNYGGFVAQAAAQLTPKLKDAKLKPDTVNVADLLDLVDQAQGSTIPASLRKDVSAFASALIRPVIATSGAKMFSPLVQRLGANPSQTDLCNVVDCLKSDQRAFDCWRKEYKSNLVASAQLLQHCADHESGLVKKSEAFRTTLLHFRSVNHALTASNKQPEGLEDCIQLSESLIGSNTRRAKKGASSLKTINYLLIASLVALVYYDIHAYGEGQWSGSRVAMAMQHYGVTDRLTALHQRCEPYLVEIGRKTQPLVDTVSVYVAQAKVKIQPVVDTASPYILQAKDVVCEKSHLLIEKTSFYTIQLRDTVHQKGDEYFPGLWQDVDKKYQMALVVIKETSSQVAEKATHYAQLGMELGAKYYHQGAELTSTYTQCVRQSVQKIVEQERVQHALKYTYEIYHKALHAVGICTH